MATTSIWSVKGWLGKILIYVENPEKTKNPEYVERKIEERERESLADVIDYAVNPEKTKEIDVANEQEIVIQQYVSGINCSPMTARMEMMAVKKRYGKDEGIMAFHGYQSFAPGECTPAMAHEIGVELAKELWGERYQVLVATHLDKKNHLHNHFVVNSVSFRDGIRYHRTNQDYWQMRQISDRLCREHHLSVPDQETQKRGKHYGEWRAEQEGKPTYRGLLKADIDEVISRARTEKQFFFLLKEKGYTYKVGKDITVRAPGRDRGMKLARNFGDAYTIDAIRRRILEQNKKQAVMKKDKTTQNILTVKVRGTVRTKRKIGGLRGLYLHYCYRLGILPKNSPQVTPEQVHILFREDLCKLETITKETRLLCRYQVDTTEQLFSLKGELQEKLEMLDEQRKHLRYRIRSMKDSEMLSDVKKDIAKLSEQMKELREEVRLCEGIAERSENIKDKLKLYKMEQQKEKEEGKHEYSRRCR